MNPDHAANHPAERHLCTSVDDLNPRSLDTDTLQFIWASPGCTHHSVAGGPLSTDQITPRVTATIETNMQKWRATQHLRFLTIDRLIWSGLIILSLIIAFLALSF